MASSQPLFAGKTQSEIEDLMQEIKSGCYAYTDLLETSYGYTPSFAGGIVISILFAIPFLYHTFRSVQLRKATSILFALGALTELIGWASRAWAAKCPYNRDAFLSQIVTLIIAPVFFSAALYVLLGKLINDLGRSSSFLSAKWYTIVFCTCDIVSLVVQAAGGAMASMADTDEQQDLGTNIMEGGIVFQLATMTLFGFLVGDFARRISSAKFGLAGAVTRNLKLVLAAIFVSFVMIYIRSIYRTIELAQGWRGHLITHEVYFIALDAAMMIVAVAVFVPADPAVLLGGKKYASEKKQSSSADVSDAEVAMAGPRYDARAGYGRAGEPY
ncbi:RTA1 domain-containing protein [Diaporthe helianthi]|uniref:RTA1 domain-containing protein n=1 Tax=Diaporthe helianthi TaxID=158607 RepID=A0A2P5I8G4_DIAHE|nr:RTA1 domain-containing protein [Diaporthe helianthi]